MTVGLEGGESEPLEAEVDLLRDLADLRDAINQAETTERELVGRARAAGSTWAEIAEALGVSLRTVHRRFGAGSREIHH